MNYIKVIHPKFWSKNISITYGENEIFCISKLFKIGSPCEMIKNFREYKQDLKPILYGEIPTILEQSSMFTKLL